MNDPLDRAIGALREEALPEEDGTLERILASVATNDPVDAGAELLRAERFDQGGDATLGRVHRSLAARRERRRALWAIAAAAVLGIALGAPSAWAWGRARVAEWIEAAPAGPATNVPAPLPAPSIEPRRAGRSAPSPIEPAIVEPVAEPASEGVNTGSAIVAPVVEPRLRPARATRDRPAPIQPDVPALEPERVPDADTIAFREAHRAHFEAHDEAAALAGWDRYLSSHPQGRYRLEARYNRALALVRSGRHREAREALASFARGEHRGYRQEEAAALVEALDARLEGQPPSSLDGQR